MSSASRRSARTPSSSAPASRQPQTRPLRLPPSPVSLGEVVAVELKFCGLTRDTDVAYAVSLGAEYVGVIFAESPRRIDPAQATTVLAPARGRARTVGVFGPASIEVVASVGADAALDVVQLHGDPSPGLIERLRPFFGGEVWAVIRIAGSDMPPHATALMGVADAVVLDAKVPG